MPKYIVPFKQLAAYRVEWEVETDTPERARELVSKGYGTEIHHERIEWLDDIDWEAYSVEEKDEDSPADDDFICEHCGAIFDVEESVKPYGKKGPMLCATCADKEEVE